jgi:hypothetical protein
MKFGKMKYDVPFEKLGSKTDRWDFNALENFMIKKEGKYLYKLYPSYVYLKDDPDLKSDGDFYISVVFAYMVDCIKRENPKYIEWYIKNHSNCIFNGEWLKSTNHTCLNYYRDYLREQAEPGCLEREKAQHKKELQESIALHAAMAKMDEERHPHVPCPYCKSTNTEKISTMSRAVSVSLVGAASGKIGKQWHCKQCGSNF